MLFLVLLLVNSIVAEYSCILNGFILECNKTTATDIIGEMSAAFNKGQISSLTISHGQIETISSQLLEQFTNVQSLTITSSNVMALEDGAFSLHPLLQDLMLKNNKLEVFNWKAFEEDNILTRLDLSYNRLTTLNGVNFTYFVNLAFVDLTSNQLKYLSSDFLNYLSTNSTAKLYVVIENNPWDCSDDHWSDIVNTNIITTFCNNNSYDPEITWEPSTVTEPTTIEVTSPSNINYHVENDTKNCRKTQCFFCVWYWCCACLFIAFGAGILFGCAPTIKDRICSKKREKFTVTDDSTQCEYSLVELRMVSGIFDVSKRKFVITSTMGMPVNK